MVTMLAWGILLTVAAIAVAPNDDGMLAQFAAGFRTMFALFIVFAVIAVVFGSWAPAVTLGIGILSLAASLAIRFFGDVTFPAE